jgi:3-oxoacyl-[acyl-carrier protein] reductase
MDLGLTGKVALITGASSGIGREIARVMAAEGVNVFGVARDGERLVDVMAEIAERTGGASAGLAVDVTDEGAAENAVAAALRQFGALHILVNNAGRAQSGGIQDNDRAVWQGMAETKLFAMAEFAKAAIPEMKRAGWGRIVNISSIGGIYPTPKLAVSHALSAAINNATKSLAVEVAGDRILVNAVCVGAIATDNWRNNMIPGLRRRRADLANLSDEEIVAIVGREKTPIGRFGTAEEIARLTAFLASEANGFVTGAAIEASGGADRFI